MPTLNITRPNLMTPVPHPTHIPGLSPSGRGVNPATGRIGDMPGGMDYLAGLGPAPAGVNIPNAAPIINLANLAGGPRPVETPQQKIARWLSSGSPWQAAGAQRLQNQMTGGAAPGMPAPTPVQGVNTGTPSAIAGFNTPPAPQTSSPFSMGNPGGRIFPQQQSLVPQQNTPFSFGPFRTGRF